MPNRIGTRSRNGGSAETASGCPAKYSPTSKVSSYTPWVSSSPPSSGSSVRPSAFVWTALSRRRSPLAGSQRASSTRMPAAGRPRAVSRTWVVRPAMRVPPFGLSSSYLRGRALGLLPVLGDDGASPLPLYPTFDVAVRVLRCVEDLFVVLDPESLQVVDDVVHVGERVPNLLYLRERL